MRFLVLLFLCVFPELLTGQNRYWVAFADKANSSFSVSNPQAFLSPESIKRRLKNKADILEEDLPVNPDYIQNVRNAGAKILYALKWFNGAVVQCEAATAQKLKTVSGVKSVELAALGGAGGREGEKGNGREESGGNGSDEYFQKNEPQRKMLDLDTMNRSGFYGEGINVAVFDDGFAKVNSLPAFAPLFSENRVTLTKNLANHSESVYDGGEHGVRVLSVMAAASNEAPGSLSKANYFLFHTEEKKSEYRIEEYNWARAMEMADSAGVHLVNSSLGYSTFDDISMNYTPSQLDGNTAVITKAAAKGVSKGIVVVTSAGNAESGWRNILFPADARGVIAVGSVDAGGVRSSSSTVGPAADGRIKPDVMAPGVASPVINSSGEVTASSGTSFASPLVACLAGGILQAYPQLTAAQATESIISSADRAASPNNKYGYGIPRFLAAKNYIEKKPLNLKTSAENSWTLFPNPASNIIHIKSVQPPGLSLISLWDSMGREIFQTEAELTWANNPLEVDISFLEQGFYYLKIKSPNGNFVKRIMKK